MSYDDLVERYNEPMAYGLLRAIEDAARIKHPDIMASEQARLSRALGVLDGQAPVH